MTSDARWLLLAGGLILTGCPPGEALDEDEPPAPEPQEVEVEFIVQNGFRITDGEAVVYIDAFTQMSAFEADDADLILITHVMSDHYGRSRVLASAEASGAIVVGPSAVIADLEGAGIDDQLADFDDLMYGEKGSDVLAGVPVDAYFTQHIGETTAYPHLSYRVELGGRSLFLPGDMNTANWTGPLEDYDELQQLDLAMASTNFVDLDTLAGQGPAVIVEAHIGEACRVFFDYPDDDEMLVTGDAFTLPR